MKDGNLKRLTPLLVATLLSGWIIYGMAAEPKKANTDESAATFTPTNATAAQLNAKLKAKVDPKLVVVNKRTPIKFVPFALTDFKDKNGKVPTANESVTLPNGTKSTWGKYLVAINKVEKEANPVGYTLRGSGKKFKAQELAVNKTKLEADTKKKLRVVEEGAKAKSLPASPKAAEKEFEKSVKASKAIKIIAPPGIGVKLGPVTVTKSFDEPLGDSNFGADVQGSMTFTGAANSASLVIQGQTTGSILGETETLLSATGTLTAPQTGNLTAQVKITILGVDDTILNQSEPSTYSKSDTFSATLPDVFKVQWNTVIVVIPVTADIGVKGSISMPYFVGISPLQAQGYMIPDVQGAVYAQAGLGAEAVGTGLIVGVEGDFTLVNNKLTVYGSGGMVTDSKGTALSYSIISRDDLTALQGSLSLVIQAEALGEKVDLWTDTLFTFGGIVKTFNPLDASDKVYLHGATNATNATGPSK